MDEGVPGWYSPLGTQGGATLRFTERRRFERKKADNLFYDVFSLNESDDGHRPMASFGQAQDRLGTRQGIWWRLSRVLLT
jgi:hypothetical protein